MRVLAYPRTDSVGNFCCRHLDECYNCLKEVLWSVSDNVYEILGKRRGDYTCHEWYISGIGWTRITLDVKNNTLCFSIGAIDIIHITLDGPEKYKITIFDENIAILPQERK